MWANPVVSPLTTRMPAPRSRPLLTCSIRPSSRPADVDALVLGEHLGELGAVASRRGEDPLQHVPLDHRVSLTVPRDARRLPTSGGPEDARTGRTLAPMGVEVGLRGDVIARRRRRRHGRRAAAPGRSRCSARHASSRCSRRRRSPRSTVGSPAGSTTVGMRVQIDHLQPTAVGGEVVRRGGARADRGTTAHVHRLGLRRARPRRRRQGHPRRGRRRALPRQVRVSAPCERTALRSFGALTQQPARAEKSGLSRGCDVRG